jgi:hypothetical protein
MCNREDKGEAVPVVNYASDHEYSEGSVTITLHIFNIA